jgi:hypothetical protein
MMKESRQTRFFWVLSLLILGVLTRFLPHPPNFTALGAIALFGGASFRSHGAGLLLPLGVLLASDAVFEALQPGKGFYSWQIQASVYAGFLLVALLGRSMRGYRFTRKLPLKVGGRAVAGSLLFFVLTNLGVWIAPGGYPETVAGLVECFTMALPFYHYTLLGDLLFNGLLFGSAALVHYQITSLEPAPAR